jgi:DNA-binding NarL/FixJ family response regulator
MKKPGKPRILLVDDHPAVRQALALLLEEEGVGDCCEAGAGIEALEVAGREVPDIALVDLSLGNDDPLALIAEFCVRRIPVLVCSTHKNPDYVKRAMTAGARGYITKSEVPEVVRAVRGVLEGWLLVSPRAAEGLGQENLQNKETTFFYQRF